jgi:hypothetical protein
MAKRGRGRGRIGKSPADTLRQRHLAQQRFREPPTGRQAGNIARKEAGLEFNPVVRQMRSEARGSQNRERQISDWYDQLRSDYSGAQQSAADAYKTAEGATNSRLAEAGQRGNQAVSDLAAQDQSFAQLVGGPTDAQGNATRASAQQAADRQAATLTAPLTASGASYVASLGTKRTAAALRAIEAHKEEGERRGKIKQDLAKGKRERGAATVVNLEKLREGARDYATQQAAFGQKKREAGVSARQSAARIGIEAANARTSARNAATSERSQGATAHHYKTEAKAARRKERFERRHQGLTPSQQRDAKQSRQNATATARGLAKAHGMPTTAKEWSQLEAAVRAESEVSPAEAAWAVRRLRRQAKQIAQEKARGPSGAPH